MPIDVKKLLSGEEPRIKLDYSFDITKGQYPFDIPSDDAVFCGPVKVTGEIVNMDGYIRLTAEALAEYDAKCARCLKPVHGKMDVSLERTLVGQGELVNTPEEEADDYLEIIDGELDIEPCIAEELVMALPSRSLCSEDCKGLCPKCGKDLNEGECHCETKEIDPRLAVLQKLLEKQ